MRQTSKQLFLVLCMVAALVAPAVGRTAADNLLDEVDQTIRARFYDPSKIDDAWTARVAETRQRLQGVQDPRAVHAAISQLLGSLKTSHTAIYGPWHPFYYFLASTFGRRAPGYDRAFDKAGVKLPDGGFLVQEEAQGVFVQSILEGGPADRAGLKVGDRIASVDGGPWRGVEPFRKKTVTLSVQRKAAGPLRTMVVQTRSINPQEAFLEASRNSVRVVQHNGRRVGYYHIWAFTDKRIYDQADALLHDELRDVDALVLDLRDGIGGGYPDLLYNFLPGLPEVVFADRMGRIQRMGDWKKPLAVIVNERSRSSKELYANAFKTRKLATVIGQRTAGAVTAGGIWYMRDGSILYVAVSGVTVDGRTLEGVGVEPDVVVERPIPFSEGQDAQLDKALDVVSPPGGGRSAGLIADAPDAVELVGVTERARKDGVDLWVRNLHSADVTVTLSADLVNMEANADLPLTRTLAPGEEAPMVCLRSANRRQPWQYSYRYSYRVGRGDAVHDDTAVYELPYASGASFTVLQGYNGTFSHRDENQYAIDWSMPQDTPVRAARAGTVVATEDRYTEGSPSTAMQRKANFVLVRHEDGTMAEYMHLRPGGVEVTVGQEVAAGHVLGRSGNTGYSSEPHLHFMVFSAFDGTRRVSHAVRFRVKEGEPAVILQEDTAYTAP